MTERIEFIDLAKGFCIVLVVFTHLIGYYHIHYAIENQLVIFRMPLYFFLSGLFFKRYDGFVDFLRRKTNKLLIPFLFFYFLTSVLLPTILKLTGYEVRNSDLVGISSLWAFITPERFSNMPIWFLLCLFLINIIYYGICLVFNNMGTKRDLICNIVTCLIIGVVGYYLGENKKNLPMFVDSAMTALPFFCCGVIVKKYTQLLYPNKYDKFNCLFIIACIIFVYLFAGKVSYSKNNFFGTPVWSVYLCGLLGTLGVILFAKLLKRLPLFSYWGRYSIMILLTHNVIIQIFVKIADKLGLSGWVAVAVVLTSIMLLYCLIIPLMLRFLPHVTAQKDLLR